MLTDLILIVALTGWLIAQTAGGRMSPELAGLCLVCLVVFVATARNGKMKAVGFVFRFGVPIASLLASVVWYGGGDPKSIEMIALLCGTLILMLFGIYMVSRAIFWPSRAKNGR